MSGIDGEFLSEPDLTTADKSGWNSGYPPGFTVDELRFYRRRRAPVADTPSKDHLTLEPGNFGNLKTEYKRRFLDYYSANSRNALHYDLKDLSPTRTNKPDDNLLFDNELHEFRPEYHESFIEFPSEQLKTSRRQKRQHDDSMANFEDDFRSFTQSVNQSEKQSQFVKYENFDRTLPIRRSTSLKLEGDLSSTTEKAEQFIEYLLSRRRGLIRNPTHLRLEGDMEKKTENREQYVPHELHSRPPMYKQLTNLRLEGDMGITTESNEQFIPYELEMRPPFLKRHTNLHLEGDLVMNPEYRQEYVEYKTERSSPSLPRHNLKIDGFFDAVTENQSKFVGHQGHPPIPFLRGSAFNRKLLLGDDKPAAMRNAEYREKYVPHNLERSMAFKRGENLSLEGEFESITENRHEYVAKPSVRTEMRKAAGNLHLEGQIDHNPEYKNAYVDFYKTSNFSSPARRRRTESTCLRSEAPMETYPEYKRSFVDFPRHRPSVKKPETHLSSEGEMDHMTEKRAQYIEYPRYHKVDNMKREPEFKLEGDFVCQPEYRKAYIDYLIRERVDRKNRPLDNLGGSAVPQKRAFEILTPKKPADISVATPTTNTTETATSISESKVVKSMIPVSTGKPPTTQSSLTPTTTTTDETTDKNAFTSSSTNSRIPRRQVSISKLETQLFGPKIEMPKTYRSSSSSRLASRSPSPLPPRSTRTRSLSRNTKRQSSSSEEAHRDRTGSRFSNMVRVEDLAYTPATSPIPTHKLYSFSPRKKWTQPPHDICEQVDRMSAFMILDDDVNNNLDGFTNRNPVKSLYKEQKWMSSWNSPTT